MTIYNQQWRRTRLNVDMLDSTKFDATGLDRGIGEGTRFDSRMLKNDDEEAV